mgnify:CR=1 FL=1
MHQAVITLVLVTGAVLVVLVGATGMVGAAQLTLKRSHGYMHLVFYAILIMGALGIFFSGRNLNSDVDLVTPDAPARNALVALSQPLASLLMVILAGERVIAHLMKRHRIADMSPVLLFAFILFWVGTVASPALWGAHPLFTHNYVYSLVIGVAAIWSSDVESDLAIKAVRDMLLLLMVVSLFLIPFKTSLVLDTSYTQGYIPGLPRFGGLTPHPVEMGSLAQLCLLCLMVRPYHRAWLNRAAWALALLVFFLAQAKTSWLGFLLCSACIVAIRSGPSFWRRVSDPLRPEFGVLCVSVFMAGVLALTLFLMFGHPDSKLTNFFSSPEGEQLSTLTGRIQIWAVAYDEWLRHPVFGYGPSIWDESFRTSIGMPFATHAHNQFLDILSRSGSVGAASFVIYALVLLILSVRYARVSSGLTLALFLMIAVRSISEVPLTLFGYSDDLVAHLLLLMTLAGAASEMRTRKVQLATTHQRLAPLQPAADSMASAGFNS